MGSNEGQAIRDAAESAELPEGVTLGFHGSTVYVRTESTSKAGNRAVLQARRAVARAIKQAAPGRRLSGPTAARYDMSYSGNVRLGISALLRVSETEEERERHGRGLGGIFAGTESRGVAA